MGDTTRKPISSIGDISTPEVQQPKQISDLFGMYKTVTTVPTLEPKRLIDQIQFYTDSLTAPTTYKLYMWSTNLRVWKSITLT